MMPLTLRSAIATFLFVFCLVAPASALPSESTDRDMSICSFENMQDARKHYSTEQTNISRTGGRGGQVVRNKLQLQLRTRDGLVVLTDNCFDGESYVRYRFKAYLTDIGYFLIGVDGYEGHGFLLVNDRTGNKTDLEAMPVFSPDRKQFVTMSMDLDAGYHPNSIQIWQLDPSGPKLGYKVYFDNAWGPSDPVWIDNRTIEFKKNILVEHGSEYKSSRALLIKKDSTWEIKEPSQ